jgi:UDP-2,3-diacylglucosamine hydrolase
VSRAGDLVFIGDVHLERDDPALPAFVAFLERLGQSAARVVLLGDLFNVWIGDRQLEGPHQTAVVRRLEQLRRRGVFVRYVEGNRDYRIARCYAGTALDTSSERPIVERFGGRSIWAAHGDLVNPADRNYRLWRRFSRSAPVWWLFRLVPSSRRLRLADALENRLRSTNLAFKSHFPEGAIRAYAEPRFATGHDVVVLGHFHVERELRQPNEGVDRRILVLPEWRESRRHLRIGPEGDIAFVDSPSVGSS